MTLGQLLLPAGLAAGAAAFALAAARRERLATLAARAHAGIVVSGLAILVASFLAKDFSYAYVHGHTSVDYPFAYRLAGVWGGEEGTLLLWNAGVAAAVAMLLRKGAEAGTTRQRAAFALLAFSLALTLIGVVVDVFAPTTPAALAGAPGGRGLADVLLTPLMVVHPPVQFVAYALLAAPGAFAVAHLWSGGDARAWAREAYPWARVAWLFATLGLGLGALWAYYVLSFGGYWAWDPVETSNLLPWLALTAFLHAGKHQDKFGDQPNASILLALAAPVLAVFATFATRSGLWASVHAFTDPTDRFEPDAAARLLAILDVHPPTRAVLALLGALALVAVALFARHRALLATGASRAYLFGHAVVALALAGAFAADPRAAWGVAFEGASRLGSLPVALWVAGAWLVGGPPLLAYLDRDAGRTASLVDPRRVMSAAVALFAVALAVTFVLNLQVVDRPERARFDVRTPYVVLPLVSVLTVMMALPPLGKRGAVALAAGGAAAGLLLFALAPEHRVVALAFPFCVAAALAAILRLVRVQGGRAWPAGVLLGSALVLLVVASNPPTHVGALALPSGPWTAAAGLLAGTAGVVLALRVARGRLDRGRVREAGIALVHLAVALGVLGYAASTYSQARETFTAVPIGSELAVGDYVLAVLPAETSSDAEGLASATIPLRLSRDGKDAGEAELGFAWRGAPSSHYAPRLEVRRLLTEDVYVSPLAFHTSEGWVGGGSAGARVAATDVDAVSFTASVLPLVGLVWAGLWMGLAGMALIIAAPLARHEQR